MSTTVEDLALLLARDEAQKQLEPKHYWPPTPSYTIIFAGQKLTQDDLAELMFEKHKDRLLTEAATILAARTHNFPPLRLIKDD